MRIAMIGTRGVPAMYGGFETAVEEIGSRLAAKGHDIVVYCRQPGPDTYMGMRRVELDSIKSKTLDTLSHTFVSARHAVKHEKPDMAFVFNAANSPFVPMLRRHGIPVALHTDGLEWQRSKWGRVGRNYYLFAERHAVKHADALISDAQGIADYYRERYGATSNVIAYGAPIVNPSAQPLEALGLLPREFLLIVARFEPENHVLETIEGAIASNGDEPIVVVGSSPYAAEYNAKIEAVAATSPRVRLLGGVWDQDLLNSLYGHARIYIHGHSVGGTNPSLLRALGAGSAVATWDVSFNREVAGECNLYWSTADELGQRINRLSAENSVLLGRTNQLSVASRYRWDDVASDYLRLADSLCGKPADFLNTEVPLRLEAPRSRLA